MLRKSIKGTGFFILLASFAVPSLSWYALVGLHKSACRLQMISSLHNRIDSSTRRRDEECAMSRVAD